MTKVLVAFAFVNPARSRPVRSKGSLVAGGNPAGRPDVRAPPAQLAERRRPPVRARNRSVPRECTVL